MEFQKEPIEIFENFWEIHKGIYEKMPWEILKRISEWIFGKINEERKRKFSQEILRKISEVKSIVKENRDWLLVRISEKSMKEL